MNRKQIARAFFMVLYLYSLIGCTSGSKPLTLAAAVTTPNLIPFPTPVTVAPPNPVLTPTVVATVVPSPSPTTSAAPVASYGATGHVDGVYVIGGKHVLQGWACDIGSTSSIAVQIYLSDLSGAAIPLGTFPATAPSGDPVAYACSSSGRNYRFVIPLDDYSSQYGGLPLFVYVNGISPQNSLVQLPGALTTIPLPPTVVTVVAVPSLEAYQGAYRIQGGGYLSSCDAYLKSTAYGGQGDGPYWINPGAAGAPPFPVSCKMDSVNQMGWTLCGSFMAFARGAQLSSGFDFISAVWNTGTSIFMNSSLNQVQSAGNFCSLLPMSQIYSEVRSSTAITRFQTGIATVPGSVGNPFQAGSGVNQNVLYGKNAAIGIMVRNSFGPTFYGGTNCVERSNDYSQGSDICVGDGNGNFQLLMGNINNAQPGPGGPGDWMCAENTQCQSGSDTILFYVR